MNIEIARSYGEKISLGNYCMADFFCSAKCEVDDIGDNKISDQASKELYEFCKSQVKRDIDEYKQEIINKTIDATVHVDSPKGVVKLDLGKKIEIPTE